MKNLKQHQQLKPLQTEGFQSTDTHTHTNTGFYRCALNLVSILLLFFISMQKSNAQNLLWQNSYGNANGNESHGYSIKQTTTDGGFIVCGSIYRSSSAKDIYLVRLNADGDTMWTKIIGGALDDEGYCVNQTTDGGFIVAGYTKSYGSGSADFFLVKTGSTGTIEWTRTNGGTLDESSYSIVQTMDGGYMAVGYTRSTGAGSSDMKAVKFNSS